MVSADCCCVALLLVVWLVSAATGTDLQLFVSSLSGNDTNNGTTRGSAVRTLAHAAQLAAGLGSASANLSVVLFDDQDYEACMVSMRPAASFVRLVSQRGATIRCSRHVDASGLDSLVGVFEVWASSGIALENVSIVDFSSFNVSAVALTSAIVELRNVTLLNNTVEAESFDRVGSVLDPRPPRLVLRSPLAINASATVTVTASTFRNNSLHVTPIIDLIQDNVFPGSMVFEQHPTLQVPGGGALVVSAGRDVSIEACVFTSNRLSADALDPQLFQYIGLGVKSAVAGGSLLVIAQNRLSAIVSDSQFVDSSVAAEQMCGGGVAFLAMRDLVRAYVYDSSFVRSSHVGGRSNGVSVALVDWSVWQSPLVVQRVSFRDTVVADVDNVVQLQGAAALAFQLGIENCTVSGFNITLAFDGTVSGGLFSGAYIGATDLVITDNVFDVSNGECGLLIGPYQNASMAPETWCNFIDLSGETIVARNSLAVSDQMFMSLIRTASGSSCAEIRERLPNGFAFNTVRGLRATDNQVGGQGVTFNAPIGMLEFDSDDSVGIEDCTVTNNTWNIHVLRVVASGGQIVRSNFSENDAPDHHLVLVRVTGALDLLDLHMLLDGDARGGLMGTASTFNITRSSFVGVGGTTEALRLDGAAPDAFSSDSGSRIDRCEFRHAGVTILSQLTQSAIINSTLIDSPVVAIVTAVDEFSAFSMRSLEFEDTVFLNCTPAVNVRSVEFGSVLGDQAAAAIGVNLRGCTLQSALADETAHPLLQVECDGAIVQIKQSSVSAAAQRVASMQCELFSINESTIVGSSGIDVQGGSLSIENSRLLDVGGSTVRATSNATLMLSDVALVGCAPIVAHGVTRVELANVSIVDATLATSAVDVAWVETLVFADVRIAGVAVAGAGTVTLSHVSNFTLDDSVVDSCTAMRGAAFAVGALGAVACRNASALNNRARVAGGAVYAEDASAARLLDCLTLANNTAGAYGADRAAAQLHLNLSRGSDTPPMPGVGLLQLQVALVDEFGQRQRQRADGLFALRDVELTVRANLSCDAHGNVTRREVFVCLIAATDEGCTVDLPLPVATRCVVDLAAPPVRGAQLNVSLSECAFGFGVESTESPVCVACLPDSTAIGGNSSCRACPPGARCCGAASVFAQPEHYLVENEASSALVSHRCLPGVCLGSNASCSDTRHAVGVGVPRNRCAPFRKGPLCAACNETRLIPIAPDAVGGGACLVCDELNIALLVLALVGLAAAAVVIHINTAGSSAALKILLYYTQVAGLQSSGGLVSEVMSTVFGFRLAAASGSFGGVCIAPLDHFGLVLSRLCLPFVLLALLLLVAGVSVALRACWRRVRGSAKRSDSDDDADDAVPDKMGGAVVPLVATGDRDGAAATVAAGGGLFARRRVFRTGVAIVLLTFSVALEASLDVLHCVAIGGDSLLASDVRQSCTADRALIWQRAAMFGLLPLGVLVIVSVVGALLLLRRANGSRLPDNHPVLGVLFECYVGERARLLWEAFVLVRRLAIGLIAVFVASFPLKHFLFTLVNTASLLATIFERPFADNAENQLDIVAQMFLVLLGGVVVEQENLGDGFRTFIVVLTTAPVVVIVGFMCRARFVQLRAWFVRRKLKK
jgi:hypothetical protein